MNPSLPTHSVRIAAYWIVSETTQTASPCRARSARAIERQDEQLLPTPLVSSSSQRWTLSAIGAAPPALLALSIHPTKRPAAVTLITTIHFAGGANSAPVTSHGGPSPKEVKTITSAPANVGEDLCPNNMILSRWDLEAPQ